MAVILLGVGVLVGIAIAQRYIAQPSGATAAQPLLRKGTILTNEDVFEWVDYRGVPRKIVRHRRVKFGEP